MGLDVYLTRYEDHAATQALEAEYTEKAEANWPEGVKYDDVPEDQRDAIRDQNAAMAKSMGLGDWGDDQERTLTICLDSEIDPEHLFKVGYFRSSYNPAGINSLLRQLLGVDMDDIFNPGDEYCFQPNWAEVKAALELTLEEFKAKTANGYFRVLEESFNAFTHYSQELVEPQHMQVQGTDTALALFLDTYGQNKDSVLLHAIINDTVLSVMHFIIGDLGFETVHTLTWMDRHPALEELMTDSALRAMNAYQEKKAEYADREEGPFGGHNFSCLEGTFYLSDPVQMLGMLQGSSTFGNAPAAYVLWKDVNGTKWVETAIQIMMETCDYVLAQDDAEKYWLHWSG